MSQVVNQTAAASQTGPGQTSQQASLLFLYAETALHAGTGASLGTVDLPIQRERTTEFPKIQSSSVKGVLRAETESKPDGKNTANLLYGPNNQEYAGALALGDARILLFPVRSLTGLFVWITCPTALARLLRDLKLSSVTPDWQLEIEFEKLASSQALVACADNDPKAPVGPIVPQHNQIALEEFLFTPIASENVRKLTNWLASNALPNEPEYKWWRDKLSVKKHLVVLTDEDFRDFVTGATEVVARIAIDQETKTAADTGLWYQEFLPGESLLYSVALAQAARQRGQGEVKAAQVLQKFKDTGINRIQIGGEETIGKGFCRLRYS